MKNLPALFILLFVVGFAYGQEGYTPLPVALKNPHATEKIEFSPHTGQRQYKKFYNRKSKFTALQSVYIKSGFDKKSLETLLAALSSTDIFEIVWECDTLPDVLVKFASLQNISRFTLVNPSKLTPAAAQQVAQLPCTSLTLKETGSQPDWGVIRVSKKTQELSLLSDSTADYSGILSQLAGHPQLESLTLSVSAINKIPKEVDRLPGLKHLAILKNSDLAVPENDLLLQPFWVSAYDGITSKIISLDYIGANPITDEEKSALLLPFPHSSFAGSPATIEKTKNAPRTAAMPTKFLNQQVMASTSAVTPLIPAAETQRSFYRIHAENTSRIEHPSGSTISIPGNAFTDMDGNMVEGPVDISYREMKTPAEILLAGIPMGYDSAGELHQFQSAGNFEIQAAQNGNPLQLAPGKEIRVDFVSADAEGGYNLYSFDPKTSNWKYISPANNTVTQSNDSAPQPQPQKGDAAWEMDSVITGPQGSTRKVVRYPFDITPFDDRFYSKDHVYLKDTGEIPKPKHPKFSLSYDWWPEYNKWNKVNIKPNRKLVKINISPARGVKSDSLYNVKFSFDQAKLNKKANQYFPELKAFIGREFRVLDAVTKKDFKKRYTRKKTYYDIRIEYTKNYDYCLIHLKDASGITTIEADVTDGRTGRAAHFKKLNFYFRYKRYMKMLAQREKEFNDANERRKKYYENRINTNVPAAFVATVNNNLIRTFTLAGLGVYNCDQIRRLESPVARFKSPAIYANGDTITTPVVFYVIDKKVNGVLTYYQYSPEYGIVPLNKQNTITVIALDNSDWIYYTTGPMDAAINGAAFNMTPVDKNSIKTTRQFEELIGL